MHLAKGRDAAWLHTRLRELCAPFGTDVQDAEGGRLRIPLQGSGTEAAGGVATGGSAGEAGGLLSKLRGMLQL